MVSEKNLGDSCEFRVRLKSNSKQPWMPKWAQEGRRQIMNTYIKFNNGFTINLNTMKAYSPYDCAKSCAIDNPTNREYDKAAAEVLKMAKVWFTKCEGGGSYEITHWGSAKIATYEDMKKVIKASYPESLASKILDLLEGASMNFVISGVTNLTQFKEYWANYFRPMVKAA